MSENEKPVIAGERPIIEEMPAGEYWWCTCGRSTNQPFCDGSHKGTGLTPLKFELKEPKRVAWCTCKHTKKSPLCDGSHNRLPEDACRSENACHSEDGNS